MINATFSSDEINLKLLDKELRSALPKSKFVGVSAIDNHQFTLHLSDDIDGNDQALIETIIKNHPNTLLNKLKKFVLGKFK